MDSSNHTAESVKMANAVLTTIAGSLSIFGTIFIVVTFIVWRDLRTNSRKILVYISIGDFLTALVNTSGVWGTTGTGNFCKSQATLNIAAILSSFFWTVYLSLYLYLTLCIGMRSITEKRVMAAFHVTAWGIPLVVAVLAVSLGAVGTTKDTTSDGWCWISTELNWKMLLFWMVFAGKGWEIISYVAISFFYIKVKLFLKQQVIYMNI
jgi:G protein-coupled receptor 157